jgi:hypothetical protein
MEVDLRNLADVYLRHSRCHNDKDFWAREGVTRITQADLGAGWKLTLLLLERASVNSVQDQI